MAMDAEEIDNPPPRRRRTQLESIEDVRRVMVETCRKLRSSRGLMEAEVARSRALIYALSTLAQLINHVGISQVSDAVLAAEIIRRRDTRLGFAAPGTEAQQ